MKKQEGGAQEEWRGIWSEGWSEGAAWKLRVGRREREEQVQSLQEKGRGQSLDLHRTKRASLRAANETLLITDFDSGTPLFSEPKKVPIIESTAFAMRKHWTGGWHHPHSNAGSRQQAAIQQHPGIGGICGKGSSGHTPVDCITLRHNFEMRHFQFLDNLRV